MTGERQTPTEVLQVFDRVATSLGITLVEKYLLLDLSESDYRECLRREHLYLSEDCENRLGYFLNIVELAANLVGNAGDWLHATNHSPIFKGSPPIELLLHGRSEGFLQTLNYLKNSHGGWAT